MKRIFPAILMMVCLIALILGACVSPQTEAPLSFWREESPLSMPTRCEVYTLPLSEGVQFEAYAPGIGIVVSRTPSHVYAMFGLNGEELLPFTFSEINCKGGFILAKHTSEADMYRLYNGQGQVLLTSTDPFTLREVDAGYCAVSLDGHTYLLDTIGTRYFSEGSLSADAYLSICDDYILSIDRNESRHCIWLRPASTSASPEQRLVRLAEYSGMESIYSVTYVGDHRFVVVDTHLSTAPTYFDRTESGTLQGLQQDIYQYNARTNATTTLHCPLVVQKTVNAYSPQLTPAERASFSLKAGYTALRVAILDEAKQVTGYRDVVADARFEWIGSYPHGINPTAIMYQGGRGFAGLSLPDYEAGLFDEQGNLLWHRAGVYADMHWSSNVLTGALLSTSGYLYGAYDQDGDICVPFSYDYLSPFIEGVAIGKQNGIYYRIEGDTSTAIAPHQAPDTLLAFGLYAHTEDAHLALRNLRGEGILICDTVLLCARSQSDTYVLFTHEGKTKIAILHE